MPNYSGTPGPVRLQRFGVWLAILFRTCHNQPHGAGRRCHERHPCFRRRENTTCEALCELPLDTVSGRILGLLRTHQKLPEDVEPGSENLLFLPSKKGGNNCPLFRGTVGTWRLSR